MVRFVVVRPTVTPPVIEFGGPEDFSMLDGVALLQEMLGRRLRVWRAPLGVLRFVGWVVRPFHQAPDAVLEIVRFVEGRGLRADKGFLSEFPITLTSFRGFLREQLELPSCAARVT